MSRADGDYAVDTPYTVESIVVKGKLADRFHNPHPVPGSLCEAVTPESPNAEVVPATDRISIAFEHTCLCQSFFLGHFLCNRLAQKLLDVPESRCLLLEFHRTMLLATCLLPEPATNPFARPEIVCRCVCAEEVAQCPTRTSPGISPQGYEV